jgi:putative membrane protein
MQILLPEFWNESKQRIALGVTAFFLGVGIVGYKLGLTWILLLTPVILTAILAMMLIVWHVSEKAKFTALGLVFIGGFLVEQIGIHTGWLFGNYSYGTLLGFKAFGVPLLIGLTWCIVTLSAWHIVSFGKLSALWKFALAGILVVMFDLILEQFAVVYGLWSWKGGEIPLYNYVSWFAISLAAFYVYFRLTKRADSSLYIAGVLPLLALFFWLMLLGK